MFGTINFLQLQHICQMVLSLYGLRHSYVAILKLQGYEEATKKLAEWSDTVAQELYKTRTTQSIGCIAVSGTLQLGSNKSPYPWL